MKDIQLFSTAVEVVIVEFEVPEQIAAVTFLALGDALPEIMLNTISSLEGSAGLSLPETLGSALIAFGLIPPLCVVSAKFGSLRLLIFPIMRDVRIKAIKFYHLLIISITNTM